MAKFSNQLLNMLCQYLMHEVCETAMYGVTYTMIGKEEENTERFKHLMDVRKEATACGYEHNQIFTVHTVSNGYIFDMDVETAKQVMVELSKTISEANSKEQLSMVDTIRETADKKRAREVDMCTNRIIKEIDKVNTEVTLAMYNKNSSPIISVTGTYNGDKATVRFDAYSLRIADINRVNSQLGVKTGKSIKEVSVGEILPNKNGVLCTLKIG